MCVCVCMYTHYRSKVFSHPQKFLFLILKVLFLMKEVKHHKGFINILNTSLLGHIIYKFKKKDTKLHKLLIHQNDPL